MVRPRHVGIRILDTKLATVDMFIYFFFQSGLARRRKFIMKTLAILANIMSVVDDVTINFITRRIENADSWRLKLTEIN